MNQESQKFTKAYKDDIKKLCRMGKSNLEIYFVYIYVNILAEWSQELIIFKQRRIYNGNFDKTVTSNRLKKCKNKKNKKTFSLI